MQVVGIDKDRSWRIEEKWSHRAVSLALAIAVTDISKQYPGIRQGEMTLKKNEKYCCLDSAMTPVMAILKNASGSDARVPSLCEACASLPLRFISRRQLRF